MRDVAAEKLKEEPGMLKVCVRVVGSLRAGLERALGEAFSVEGAPDVARALAGAAAAQVSVVVAGGAEAAELATRLHELPSGTQVVLRVGAAEAAAFDPALQDARVHLVVEPASDARLAAAVRQATETFQLRTENARLAKLTREQRETLDRLSAEVQARAEAKIQSLASATRGWELTFDTLDLPLAVVGADFAVDRANLAYARAAGKGTRDLMDRPRCHAYLFGRSEPCTGCPLPEALSSGREGRAEISHQDTTYVLSVHPMDGGQAVCSYRDVTEERAITRRLMHTDKMAAVGRLAGGVAHEINNPLGGILAFSQLMLRDDGRSPGDIESLSLIEESALRCKRIVESLLRFARASRGEDRRPFNLSRCVEDAAILFRAQMKGAPKAKLELELRDGLPEVVGDPARLAQVVLNLLQNGLDSLPKMEGVLTLSTGEQNGRVFFRVKDTGTGISQADLPHIFEPHFTTRPPGENTGLGLSIAYRIVEDHGGTFTVDTEPGRGSTFTVTLPVPPAGSNTP